MEATALIVTVTLNPSIDRTLVLGRVRRGNVNYVDEVREDPSGKGINVSLALRALGTESVILAVVAGSTGDRLGHILDARGLTTRLVRLPSGETRINTKIYEQEEGLLTEMNEHGPAVDRAAVAALRDELARTVAPGDVVVFAGSLPPGCPAETYKDLGRELQRRGARVVIDTSGPALKQTLSLPPYIVKPNLEEARQLLDLPLSATRQEVVGQAERLWREVLAQPEAKGSSERGCGVLILSLGQEGAFFFTPDGTFRAVGPVEAGTTAGCGDALLASTLWARQQGLTWMESARFAAASASATAAIIGTRFPVPKEIERRLTQVVVTPEPGRP